MAIERWELAQRQKGNVHGADMAKVLRDQYGDVPLPSMQDFSREQPTLHIERFSPETRAKLKEVGYQIYALTGQSIRTLRDAGKSFWSTWHSDYLQLEAMQSRLSEVAVNPDQLFLPDSSRKTLAEQEKMVEEFSRGLKIDGVEVVIGEMPEYVELGFTHFDVTGDNLFGRKFALTKTPTSESDVACVGFFRGLNIAHWNRGDGHEDVFVAPLVVPKVT